MKIRTVLQTFTILLSFLFVPFYVLADNFETVVTVSINTDIHSEMYISPTTIEVLQDGNLQVKVVDASGNPKSGRNLELYVVDGDASKLSFTIPSQTGSDGISTSTLYATAVGNYKICVKDITDVGNVINIEDCKTVSVIPTPAPNMDSEPNYTSGSTNTVSWSSTGSLSYEYFVECSTNSDFSNVVASSGWITSSSHTFNNLSQGQIYFYRVKARNPKGNESAWSNTVYSVQRVVPPQVSVPEIVLQKVSLPEDVYVDSWNSDDIVSLTYVVKDSVDISESNLFYLSSNGERIPLVSTLSKVDDLWVYTIKLSDLPKDTSGNLFEEYKIGLEVVNINGSKSTNIDGVITFKKRETEDTVPTDGEDNNETIPKDDSKPGVTTVPSTPKRLLGKVIDSITQILEELGVEEVEKVAVITAVTNVGLGVGLLFNVITSLPAQMFQLFISFLTLIGIRKKGLVTGYIYDSQTKDSIERAIVRIYTRSGSLVWTDVSNEYGYFRTIEVENGEYRIDVKVNGYTFPSRAIFGSTDFPLDNIYHGDFFQVTDGTIPNFSIPLDRNSMSEVNIRKENLKLALKIILQILYVFLVVVGLLFTLYAVYVSPTWLNYLILALYLPSLFTIIYLFILKRDKYGIVKERGNGKLAGITVGLYDLEFNRLHVTRVTDARGRYRFIVSPGSYYISIITPEYTVIDRNGLDNIEVRGKAKIICPNITVVRNTDTTI